MLFSCDAAELFFGLQNFTGLGGIKATEFTFLSELILLLSERTFT